ncbi:hypothetical protein LOD99_12347 [Oopsacas minuta]|uniref:Hexosyltransferase n=1 Tax=Oopsacas minuta TaxID=111878 RepID=A0AAV7JG21_9METZ|nr:hypothetical protein LOD99_12347 [Oopsacas minuta]
MKINLSRRYIYIILILLVIEHLVLYNSNPPDYRPVNCDVLKATQHIQIAKTTINLATTTKSPHPEMFLFIIILTAPSNFGTRQVIRTTWLKDVVKNPNIKYKFFAGTKNFSPRKKDYLSRETKRTKDIVIFEDFEEHYTRLTYKMLRIMKWVQQNTNAQYYLKVDDDSYLVVERLINILLKEDLPKNKFAMGRVHKRPLNVAKTGKWADVNWILCEEYLSYPVGAGYLLTQDLMKFIAINSYRLGFHINEDTAIGAWLGGLNYTLLNDNRIIPYGGEGCDNKVFILHKQSRVYLQRRYKMWIAKGTVCTE